MAEDATAAPTETAEDNGIAVDEATARARRSHNVGDMPEQVWRRYFSEDRGRGGERRLFESPHDAAPTIRDLGHRLIVAGESAAVVRDVVDIARHRGWQTIEVTGSDRFRQMVEQEAREHGLAVKRPLSKDRQRPVRVPDPAARPIPRSGGGTGDFRNGVTGIVIGTGAAPFDGRSGQRLSPYVDLQMSDGRIRRAWGTGLPAALAREQIRVGETILLRQDGSERDEASKRPRKRWVADRQPEQSPPVPGSGTDRTMRPDSTAKPDPRHTAMTLGQRFQHSTARQRAEDPDLRAAQSQLIAARVLASAYLAHHPVAAALVAKRLEGIIAMSLDRGGRFSVATTRVRGDGHSELVLEKAVARQRATPSPKPAHPEITKTRDRGRRR